MLRSPSKKKGASLTKRVAVPSNPSGVTNNQTLVAHETSAEDKPIQSTLASTKAYSILRNANGGQSYEQNRLQPKLVQHLPPASTHSADLDDQLGNILEDNNDQHSQSIPKVISSTSTTEYATPRYITVSLEDLEQAGIDVQKLNQLSESQIQNLLAIKEQNNQHSHQQLHANQSRDLAGLRSTSSQQMTQNQAHFLTRGSEMERIENMDPDDSSLHSNGPPLLTPEEITPPMAPVMDSSQQLNGNNGDSQITITITDDGSLKLTDASHQTFFFSRDELSHRNIDATNLTDANIQEIIQMALPSLVMAKSEVGSPPLKKRPPPHPSNHKIQDPISTASLTSRILPRFPNHNGANFTSGNSRVQRPTYINHTVPSTSGIPPAPRPIPVARALYTAPPSSSIIHPIIRAPPHNKQNRKEPTAGTSASAMIGEEVEVRRPGSGRRELAIVKYHRPGFGYKVQFADGRFEWITENNMQGRTLSGNSRSQPNIGRFQSQSLSSEIRPIRRILTSLERSRAQRTQNQIRPIIAPLPNTMAQQKQRHFIGGTKSVVLNEEPHHNRPSTSKATEGETNHHFYCSVCDQNVTQSELSYLVIRVLACKPCSSSKVLVLDDDRDNIIDNLPQGTATNTAIASQNRTPSDIPPIQQNHGSGSCNNQGMIASTDGMIASSAAVKRKLNSTEGETVIPLNPEEITLNNDQNDKS
ncbi:hypothetical protein DdX_00798 [Ditylenchus destructor]|uniref:Uncharacterized protein n=1 Tax=Ditylenchus destructor TaxID=166010 RepID=A0AAD4NFU8_9BILA|nr:hypothetical protein DdX_00798 [Ditylenchus destructor]